MEQYVRKLYEVERYHRKLAKILDGQFSVEKEQVQGEIVALQEQLQAVRGQIRELGFVGSVSKEFLDRHSELKGRIDALKLQNEAYLTLLDLQDARKKADNMLKSAITSILVDIEHDVNAKMKEFNDSFYADARKAPRLHFNNYNSYTFETPDDTGTGTNYKGMVLYDLAVLYLTALLAIAHDSLHRERGEPDRNRAACLQAQGRLGCEQPVHHHPAERRKKRYPCHADHRTRAASAIR